MQARLYPECMHKIMLAIALLPVSLFAADPAWIEYGPDGPIARTIVTDGSDCPKIEIDGVKLEMRTRALPAKHYEVTSCELALPRGIRAARIGKKDLPVHKLGKNAKVALLGDTGCRRKVGDPVQDCSDPKKWPFATIAEAIAKWDPELVLHVGDYYYRDADCDGNNCTKAPFTWKRWNADFFKPAKPLLENAPWVLVRGNHEECKRAAEGWFRFLDPRPYTYEGKKQCQSNLDFTPPYALRVGSMQLIVLDSSAIKDDDADQGAMIAGQLKLYANLEDAWLMLHHPFWGSRSKSVDTPTLWTAWSEAGAATKAVSLVLTGHTHLLEMLSFNDGGPPQTIVGNGGTAMAKPAKVPESIGGRTISAFAQDDDFGYIAATPSSSGWTFDVRDVNGKTKTKCALTKTAIVCD